MTEQCAVCAYWCPWGKSEVGLMTGECRRYAPHPVQRFQVQIGSLLGSLAWLAEAKAEVSHDCPEYSFDSKADFRVYEWPFTEEDDWCGEFRRRHGTDHQ